LYYRYSSFICNLLIALPASIVINCCVLLRLYLQDEKLDNAKVCSILRLGKSSLLLSHLVCYLPLLYENSSVYRICIIYTLIRSQEGVATPLTTARYRNLIEISKANWFLRSICNLVTRCSFVKLFPNKFKSTIYILKYSFNAVFT